MKAIVIHEDTEFAARADAILRRVSVQAEINIEVSSWSVDALNEKEFSRKALLLAQDAHLIILSEKLAQCIPLSLLNWLEHWAKPHHGSEAALGILDEGGFGHTEAPLYSALSKFAHQHGLAVIRNGSPLPNSLGNLAVCFESESRSPLPVEIYQHSYYDRPESYRRFGINE